MLHYVILILSAHISITIILSPFFKAITPGQARPRF